MQKEKINSLQAEIIVLGEKLCNSLRGRMDEQHLEFIAQYFKVNEYGEALNLLEFIINTNEELLTCDDKDLYYGIRVRSEEISQLYNP